MRFQEKEYTVILSNKGLHLFASDDNKTLLIVKNKKVVFKIDHSEIGMWSKIITDD